MQLQFDTDVLERSGEKVGSLEHIVLNPETLQIVYVSVQPSEMELDELLVPVGAIDSADDMEVQLAIDEDEFDSLKPFSTYYNIAPPPDTEETEEPGLPLVPAEPAIGAATGIESIAFTPILREQTVIPGQDVTIDRDTVAYAPDGEVGKVHRIDVSDETKRIVALVVKGGRLHEVDLDVPVEVVGEFTSDTVTLKVAQKDLRPVIDV